MLRLVVLAGLLASAAWLAREAGWLADTFPVPLTTSTPYETYAQSLQRSGLADTAVGRAWLAAGDEALAAPQPQSLPWTATLTFSADSPEAWAYRVALRRGQRVELLTDTSTGSPAHAFLDVYVIDDDVEARPDHREGSIRALTFEAERDRDVIVRIQPELLREGTVAMRLRAAPALRFPVVDARSADLQSRFGDPRDGGRRSHEGVDIFASRGTPVVSASDGVVMRVGESGLGGRVIWIWDPSRGLRYYYAHLQEQRVSTGERVRAGDVIGTVGNTGNARTTPPHLHFGIYEQGRGAIDPFWFIAPARARGAQASR